MCFVLRVWASLLDTKTGLCCVQSATNGCFSGCIIVGSLFTLDEVAFLERGFAIASPFRSWHVGLVILMVMGACDMLS